MSVFVIDNHFRAKLKRIKEHAERTPYTMDDLLDIFNGQMPPPGETPGFYCVLPFGYKVVYSVELQRCKLRHLSVSSTTMPDLPAIFAVREIMKELGFVNSLERCHLYQEGKIVNVIEEIL